MHERRGIKRKGRCGASRISSSTPSSSAVSAPQVEAAGRAVHRNVSQMTLRIRRHVG